MMHGHKVSRRLKEELAWDTDKRLQDIMLFKTVISINNFVCIAIWSLVKYILIV